MYEVTIEEKKDYLKIINPNYDYSLPNDFYEKTVALGSCGSVFDVDQNGNTVYDTNGVNVPFVMENEVWRGQIVDYILCFEVASSLHDLDNTDVLNLINKDVVKWLSEKKDVPLDLVYIVFGQYAHREEVTFFRNKYGIFMPDWFSSAGIEVKGSAGGAEELFFPQYDSETFIIKDLETAKRIKAKVSKINDMFKYRKNQLDGKNKFSKKWDYFNVPFLEPVLSDDIIPIINKEYFGDYEEGEYKEEDFPVFTIQGYLLDFELVGSMEDMFCDEYVTIYKEPSAIKQRFREELEKIGVHHIYEDVPKRYYNQIAEIVYGKEKFTNILAKKEITKEFRDTLDFIKFLNPDFDDSDPEKYMQIVAIDSYGGMFEINPNEKLVYEENAVQVPLLIENEVWRGQLLEYILTMNYAHYLHSSGIDFADIDVEEYLNKDFKEFLSNK